MKIAIYNNGIGFHGRSPLEGPLGGSESGIVYMARELAAIGHDVEVYCNCPKPGLYDGVNYIHYHRFFDDFRALRWDVFIAFRSFDPLLIGRVAPRTVFWTGDAYDQPAIANLGHPVVQDHIDHVFAVSGWHRDTLIEKFGLAPDKVVATINGFRADIVPSRRRKDWNRGVYSSTPFRGLGTLLEMFPDIRRGVPRMTLDVFSSMKVYGMSGEDDRRTFGDIYRRAEQDGVTLHGSVSQTLLLERLAESGFLLYPNTFEETSCIAAIEAQACGAVVVTSRKAGLRETVEHGVTGVTIDGDPASRAYRDEFVRTVIELAANRERLRAMSESGRARAFREYTWAAIAGEWSRMFEDMDAQPVSPRWAGPLILLEKAHTYLAKGNRTASEKLLGRLQAQPFFEKEVQALGRKLLENGAQSMVGGTGRMRA